MEPRSGAAGSFSPLLIPGGKKHPLVIGEMFCPIASSATKTYPSTVNFFSLLSGKTIYGVT